MMLLQPYLLSVFILNMFQRGCGRVYLMSHGFQLLQSRQTDMLKFIGHYVYFRRQTQNRIHIVKICHNMYIRNAVRRAIRRRVQDHELIIQPLRVQNHHFTQLSAADNSNLFHLFYPSSAVFSARLQARRKQRGRPCQNQRV